MDVQSFHHSDEGALRPEHLLPVPKHNCKRSIKFNGISTTSSSFFPALKYLEFAPGRIDFCPLELDDEISFLVNGGTKLSLPTLNLGIGGIDAFCRYLHVPIARPLSTIPLKFLRRFQVHGNQMQISTPNPLAKLLPLLSALEEPEVCDFVMYITGGDPHPKLGISDNWAHVFDACSRLDKLVEYSFASCRNDSHPWKYSMDRMPFYINKQPQDGIRHTGFKSFWKVECEALDRLRAIVEDRRVNMGLPMWC